MTAITILAALVAYGAQATAASWEKDAELPKWFSVAGGVFGIVAATVLGGIAGHLIWHWAIGCLCGFAGGVGCRMVLQLLAARFGGAPPPSK